MNLDIFKEMVKENPHSLAEMIREGKISFSDAKSYIEQSTVPPLIHFAFLVHPDCTYTEFKNRYWALIHKSGDIAKKAIVNKAKILNDIRAIAIVLNADGDSLEDIEKVYNTRVRTFRQLVGNPYINDDFKLLYYKLSGDDSVLPQSAQDIFIF